MSVDRHRSAWHADKPEPLDPRSVGAVALDWARQTPAAVALRWLEAEDLAEMTYAELAVAAGAMARRLVAWADPGARVAVAATTSADWLLLEYGAALAGTPLVPINPALTDDEIEHILTTSQPALLFADEAFRSTPLLERLDAVAERVGTGPVHELRAWRALEPTDGALPVIDPATPFLVQFTSGTTGRPKGAVLSHRAALNCASLSMRRFGGRPSDNWLNVMPMHHVGGSVSVALAVLAVGATVTLLPAFEPGLVLHLIERTRATIIGAVPTMQLALLDHPEFERTDLSSLRLVQTGGSVVPTSLIERVERAFDAVVCNAYGQSEAPNALLTSPDADLVTKATTIGTPLPHRDIRIVDAAGDVVPFGVPAELVMRSPMVMDGYLGVDDATAAATLTPDGWLHTGDLCSMDERGVVRIHGRIRDVIIRGGENIYPAEIEDVMLRHPEILDIAVVGVADERWGEVPVGVYRFSPGSTPDPAELEAFGRRSLASFKVPRRWVRVDGLPMTASGKVKKHELRAWLEAG